MILVVFLLRLTGFFSSFRLVKKNTITLYMTTFQIFSINYGPYLKQLKVTIDSSKLYFLGLKNFFSFN